jgi:hypothetical protein
VEKAALLLEHKANPNIQNEVGNTPLDIARSGEGGHLFQQMLYSEVSPGSGGPVSGEKEQKLADLRTAAGGLANLPKRDRIEVRRGSESFLTITKDPQGRNRYSLLEAIASTYGIISQRTTHPNRPGLPMPVAGMGNGLPFPDFKKVIIYRRTDNSVKQTTIAVNVEDILNSGDCSRDIWLEWGDIVEIPETDHPVGQRWLGLNGEDPVAITKCIARQVTITVKGESKTLNLVWSPPGYGAPTSMLRPVLYNSGLIRVSSDLTHVKIIRKKSAEWVIDCTSDEPDLWLRDGDVIEVPEK